jgi:hypothetical protein
MGFPMWQHGQNYGHNNMSAIGFIYAQLMLYL